MNTTNATNKATTAFLALISASETGKVVSFKKVKETRTLDAKATGGLLSVTNKGRVDLLAWLDANGVDESFLGDSAMKATGASRTVTEALKVGNPDLDLVTAHKAATLFHVKGAVAFKSKAQRLDVDANGEPVLVPVWTVKVHPARLTDSPEIGNALSDLYPFTIDASGKGFKVRLGNRATPANGVDATEDKGARYRDLLAILDNVRNGTRKVGKALAPAPGKGEPATAQAAESAIRAILGVDATENLAEPPAGFEVFAATRKAVNV